MKTTIKPGCLFLLLLMTGVMVAAADISATTTPTPGEKKAVTPPKASREPVVVYFDNTEPAIEFSARDLQQTLSAIGHNPTTLKPLAEMPAVPDACYVVIAKAASQSVLRHLETRGGQKTGTMGAEAYALRKTDNSGKKGYWATGGDRVGAMYGGIHIGEVASAGSIEAVANSDHKPYIAKRGMKFNIPLDKRWAGSRKDLSFAVRKEHVDLHLKHFKRAQLVISDDYVHALNDPAERARLHQHILTIGISYRDDSIMVDGYFAGTSDRFTVRSPEYFADAYRRAPTVFELEHYGKVKSLGNWDALPNSSAARFGKGKKGPDFFRGALELLHATYIGYHGDAREWLDDNPALTRELLNRCGYWLFPKSIELPATVAAGSVAPFRVTTDNRGVAPPYHPYELRVKLSGDGVPWVGVLGRTDRSWLPGAPIILQTQLTLPADLKPGRYAVSLGLFAGSSGKDRPVEFALQATRRAPEGYYRVAEVEVTSAAQPKR